MNWNFISEALCNVLNYVFIGTVGSIIVVIGLSISMVFVTFFLLFVKGLRSIKEKNNED
ncbi:MAG: hypothetical protein Q4E88_02820 [Coriobacteriia bacterium]|nr:hypothetical protein [Coriobacteriia bacterium]